MWEKKEKNNDNSKGEKQKIPRKCAKILSELEKVAPRPIHIQDLGKRCNLSNREIRSIITSHKDIFKNVELIETEKFVQFRLNLMEKYPRVTEEPPKGIFIRLKMIFKRED